jgi:hypothetical protein
VTKYLPFGNITVIGIANAWRGSDPLAGGGGDEDNGDDDDYFEDGDDGDGDDNTGFIRQAVNENYTMQAITSVLQEWGYSMQSLPLILQTAAQMGLLSSAQLVRFCAMDNRPTLTRWLARCLPPSVRILPNPLC